MSTAIGMDTCPRCGNFTLFTDLDTRTGDYDAYCQKCGCGYHFNYKRDENYNIVTKDIVYPRNKIYFVVIIKFFDTVKNLKILLFDSVILL